MLQFIRRNKTSILISLVVGVVLFYSQPLLALISDQLVSILVAISSRFSHYYFKLVAQNDPNQITFLSAFLILTVFWLVSSKYFYEIYEAAKDQEERIKRIDGNQNEKDNDIENVNVEISRLRKQNQKMRTLIKSSIAGIFLIILFMAAQLAIYSSASDKNVSFENRVTILAVHLDDSTLKQLKADWVQMKSSEDYRDLMATLTDIEKRYLDTE